MDSSSVREEYPKLLQLIENSYRDPQKFKLEEVLNQSVKFFEALRKEYPNASSKEEKEEMLEMVQTIHHKIQEISKELSQKAGLSEEELYVLSENPSNFNPEQWAAIQETRKSLSQVSQEFGEIIQEKESQVPKNQSVKKKSTQPTKTHRPKRKGWMKT